jgi:hypothetical protein
LLATTLLVANAEAQTGPASTSTTPPTPAAPVVDPNSPPTPAPVLPTPNPVPDVSPAPDPPPAVQDFAEAAPALPTAKPAQTDEHNHGDTMEEFVVKGRSSRVGINVFGDVSFIGSNDTPHTGFTLGALGVLLSGDLSRDTSAVSEFVLETGPNGLVVDLERLLIKYKTGRWQFAAGRDHTNVGAWNAAYHHGTWLQPTVTRPRALRFEDDDGILPVHWIGLYATYRAPVANGAITVAASVGNGRGQVVDDILQGGDIDESKAVMLKIGSEDILAKNLQFGASVIVDTIAPLAARSVPEKLLEVALSPFLAYRGANITTIAEAHAVIHRGKNQTWTTTGAFVFGGYSIERYTPYAMVELRKSTNGQDPFFAVRDVTAGSTAAPSDFFDVLAGVRYDLSTWSSIKAEYEFIKAKDTKAGHSGTLNWAFGL